MKYLTRIAPLAVFLAAGCGGPSLQAPADPARAREALQSALDAWQRGEPPDSLRVASPAVLVKDPDWSAGYRLARYEIGADGDRAGVDLRYPVRLTLTDARGRTVRRNITYTVGTSPALTVVRHDPAS
jgi:hypothetical protein